MAMSNNEARIFEDMQSKGLTMDEQINPDHYQRFEGFDTIDLTEHFNFNRGNVLAYVIRAGHKPSVDEVVDLKKAQWFLDREIQRLEKAEKRSDNQDSIKPSKTQPKAHSPIIGGTAEKWNAS